MGGPFGDMAHDARHECDAFAVNAKPPAALDNLTDHVFVEMLDLLCIAASAWPERDQPAGKSLCIEKLMVANFLVQLAQMIERGADFYGFH